MAQDTVRNVKLIPPDKLTGLKLVPIKEKAAGLSGVMTAIRHFNMEMGMLPGLQLASKMNKDEGFDCPGCAWPDPPSKERSGIAEYCENGAKALAEEATRKKVDSAFFQKHSVEALSAWSDYELGKSGRITSPFYLPEGASHYQPIPWEEAFEKIGTGLKRLSDPNEAIFYTSGRTSNEAAFMYQLFVRAFGTNNLPDCSNMCHESSGTALGETLGIGKGSVTLEDLHQAEVLIVMGQNPGTNHPRMLSALKKNKENGGIIISVNPLPEPGLTRFVDPQSPGNILKGGTALADHHLPVKINGDVALLKAWMILLLEAEEKAPGTVFDLAFIQSKTEGFDQMLEDLKSQSFSECVEQSGISEPDIRKTAQYLIEKKMIIICWAMGLTQQKNAVGNIREIVNLLLMKGAVGKTGAGTCPVRGHSNVQGDRTVGIHEKPPQRLLDAIEKHFGFKPPQEHGVDAVHAIHAMQDQKARVFLAMGGNFISATPDSIATAKAMQKCDLTIQISTKLNRSHLITGKEAIILPCIARSELDVQESGEQFVSMENSMGIVHKSKGRKSPTSDSLMSEPAIIAGIAKATLNGPDSPQIDWDAMVKNYDVIRDHIEAVIPGFEQYNRRVRQPDGFYLPNGARIGEFKTSTGKAKFTVNPLPQHHLEEGRFIMMTIRTHDQYNTTIYGLDDRYRGIKGERRVVLMNADDMRENGLNEGDKVDLTSHFEGEERHSSNWIILPFQIPKGCLASYFPEANVLVPLRSVADRSNTPVSKFIVVSIQKR